MADSSRSQGHIEVLKTSELLSAVHKKLCICSETITWPSEEESKVELGREARKSIEGVKGKVYKRTSVSSTRFRQKMRMKVDVFDYVLWWLLV